MDSKEHRRAQAALAAATARDLLKLWPAFDITRIQQTWPAFRRAVLVLIRARGQVSAGIASAYYREARRAAGIGGSPPPMQSTPTTEEIVAGLESMGPFNIEKQLELGRPVAEVRAATLVNITGVVSKYTLDHGRDVILNAVKNDTYAGSRGWQREAAATACEFCLMLASRGAVYRAETVDFQSHRHCVCTATPVW